LYCHVYVHA